MTSSADVPSARVAVRRLAVALALLTACSGDGPVTPPSEANCDGVSQSVVALQPFEARILTGSAVHCAVLAGAGAKYLVMPQLTDAALPYGGYGFRIGDPDTLPTAGVMSAGEPLAPLLDTGSLVDAGLLGLPRALDAQPRLDALLRARERGLRVVPSSATATAHDARESATPLPTALDELRRFSVLNTLDATPTWAPIDARLRFEGTRVAIYVDTLASSALSDAELLSMGALYDAALAPRIFSAFGEGSDIDANGKVLFLLSPVVNAMVTADECATRGFVRGFFYGHDLASTATTSNGGEIFYAYVPDPTARWSCAHSKREVLENLPPTFVHELQHMISFGAHTVARGGASEAVWLNEGLSHLAEELGALYWESVFPAPSGRTNPTQLFPDSAAAYINPNLIYSYRYLFSSGSYSLTTCAPGSFCSQSERGGAWLLLRWIADQKGDDALRRLVQTALTGRDNLESVTGESTAALLADFAIAVSADSLDGVARGRVPARYRFASRNFRAIYRKLFEAYGIAGGIGRPFPIVPIAIANGTARTGTMRPGTFLTYSITTSASTPTVRLRFAVPDGSAFPLSSGAQLSIFRID